MAGFAYFLILWGSFRGFHYASFDNVVDIIIIAVVSVTNCLAGILP
jgi:hypothetical protein